MRPAARRRASGWHRGFLLCLAALLLGAACRAEIVLDIDVADRSGAGTVRMAVTFDEQVVAATGDLADVLRLDDVRAAGWTVDVGAPADVDAGSLTVVASKPFNSPEQLEAVLAEIDGPDGLFGDTRLTIVGDEEGATYDLRVGVNLQRRLTDLVDERAAEILGGEPFGVPLAELRERAARPLEDVVRIVVRATVPGAWTRLPSEGWMTLGNDGSTGREVLQLQSHQRFTDVVQAREAATEAQRALESTERRVRLWQVAVALVALVGLTALTANLFRVRQRVRASQPHAQMQSRARRRR